MDFIKMEGIGNDFIVTHHVSPDSVDAIVPRVAVLCDRRRGIGGDGVIFILPSDKADFRMRIINSDGSEAEMCGNGIRCFAKYVAFEKLSNKKKLVVETLAGLIRTENVGHGLIRVDMGVPHLSASEVPCTISMEQVKMYPVDVLGKTFEVTAVSMGNPHAVIFTDKITDEQVLGAGPVLEKHPYFPKRTNVEFIEVLSRLETRMRVWERGCGETQACGTGACASVVAGILNGLHDNEVIVHLPGGDLQISWNGNPQDPVFMTGLAREVFRGSVEL